MKTRRKYTREFKIEAVRMAKEPGVTLKQIGAELGVNRHLLGKRRKQMQEDGELQAFPGQGKPRDEEMAALKRELTRVRTEGDFLKEAGCQFNRSLQHFIEFVRRRHKVESFSA